LHSGEKKSQKQLNRMRDQEHPKCMLCGPSSKSGLKLAFQVNEQDEVTARFDCSEIYQSYTGILHGGMVSMLLDGAMTNCLFARKIKAVTGELTVKYLHPVVTNCEATIAARVIKSSRRLHYLEAEISQNNIILARARGKFMEFSSVDDL